MERGPSLNGDQSPLLVGEGVPEKVGRKSITMNVTWAYLGRS